MMRYSDVVSLMIKGVVINAWVNYLNVFIFIFIGGPFASDPASVVTQFLAAAMLFGGSFWVIVKSDWIARNILRISDEPIQVNASFSAHWFSLAFVVLAGIAAMSFFVHSIDQFGALFGRHHLLSVFLETAGRVFVSQTQRHQLAVRFSFAADTRGK